MGELELAKVFSSNITRSNTVGSRDLYELLYINPANPVQTQKDKSDTEVCSFHPNIHKYYIQKKRSRLKVRTVRDIRNTFEKDVYAYLPHELEKQQIMLLSKIKNGASADDAFKNMSRQIMNAEDPISRNAWQMLINVNPNNYKYPKQYVLWNGKYINVNGSLGGRTKFICKYDLGRCDVQRHNSFNFKKKTKKIGLLKNSLCVKFKPGPLGTKRQLDDSHQKLNVGEIELIRLPAPCLDLSPTYGVSLDVNVTSFLNNLRDANGTISQKWAEFSTSVVGTANKSKLVQNVAQSGITFNLNYKYDQNRILMRRDTDNLYCINNTQSENLKICLSADDDITSEVKGVLTKMLDCVELNLLQDTLFNEFDEPREHIPKDSNVFTLTNKEKTKRKYKELNRLDVTVIQLPDKCEHSFCELGCVCESLEYSHNLKRHCGLIECMFGCKCGFTRNYDIDFLEKVPLEVLPSFSKLDEQRQLKLAREEQKFHQTVIVSGEKEILLKTDENKYKAFENDGSCNIPKKNNFLIDKKLLVVTRKLSLKNVQPWCMVHSLYKCFCKNRFVEKLNCESDIANVNLTVNESTNIAEIDKQPSTLSDNSATMVTRNEKRKSFEKLATPIGTETVCARVTPFQGRKYIEDYYKATNKRILEMEQNDRKLQKKLIDIIDYNTVTYNIESVDSSNVTHSSESIDSDSIAHSSELVESNIVKGKRKSVDKKRAHNSDLFDGKYLPRNTNSSDPLHLTEASQTSADNGDVQSDVVNLLNLKNNCIQHSPVTFTETKERPALSPYLIKWLVSNYRYYKERSEKGIPENGLESPKEGKFILHSWEFLLDRYKNKKNFFLVSKKKPFRIFLAVDYRLPHFVNCINFDDIRLSELSYYPETVKKLVADNRNLKEHFCILRGHSFYWEFVGLVAKKPEVSVDSDTTDDFILPEHSQQECRDTSNSSMMLDFDLRNPIPFVEKSHSSMDIDSSSIDSFSRNISTETDESSRWFVMRIENDFSEIQFHNKGFFVKYESILKAINVARQSNKTVRISSQKCNEKGNAPQFGIYAIPNVNEYCVFVGPYETDEPLGIETIKTFLDVRKQKRTRGIWITTNKVDNLNLINNPMLFMPLSDKGYKEMSSISDDSDVQEESCRAEYSTEVKVEEVGKENEKIESKETQETKATTSSTDKEKLLKLVKPIKIRKIDTKYQLSPDSFLRKDAFTDFEQKSGLHFVSIQKVGNSDPGKKCENKSVPLSNMKYPPSSPLPTGKSVNKKPVAQIAPLVKNNFKDNVREESRINADLKKRLIILRPEEIVKILTEKKKKIYTRKNFKVQSSTEDVVVISDDDQDKEDVETRTEMTPKPREWRNVKIHCSSGNDKAWLPGRRNKQNLLSFTFPGCKPSIFYEEEEALIEINRMFRSRVKVPEEINLCWQVSEDDDNHLRDHKPLAAETLSHDFVLEFTGLHDKYSVPCETERDQDQHRVLQDINFSLEHCATSPESSVQNAIVLEDGSLFMMDENNKNTINEKLAGSTDIEKAEFISILEHLRSYNT